jgi:predicted SpoU family rRNA methylase
LVCRVCQNHTAMYGSWHGRGIFQHIVLYGSKFARPRDQMLEREFSLVVIVDTQRGPRRE